MGRRSSVLRASTWRLPALVALAVLAGGCVARELGFEDWNNWWTADVSDRTGDVVSIDVLDAAGPGADLASDGVRVRNVDASTIEVAWLGGTCVDCARFSITPESGDRIGLRYDIGPPCDTPAAAGYAVEIRFRHPVEAAAIMPIPDWGP
jgi:hypothetical protein